MLVSVGSNIEPERQIPAAVRRIARHTQLRGVSRVYQTAAVGSIDQPDYLNAAVALQTELEPKALKFNVLRAIEAELGRVRTVEKFAPRPIDLDIALYGKRTVLDASNDLVLPDPDILKFAHVAVPLADLVPDLRHPIDGRRLADIALGLRSRSLLCERRDVDAVVRQLQPAFVTAS